MTRRREPPRVVDPEWSKEPLFEWLATLSVDEKLALFGRPPTTPNVLRETVADDPDERVLETAPGRQP